MVVSVENLQQLEAALKAEVDALKNELVQVRTELAQNLQAHAAGANELQLKAELNNNKWVCMLVEQNHKLHMLCHQVLTMVRFLQTDKSLDNQLQTRIKPLMQVESSISNTAA